MRHRIINGIGLGNPNPEILDNKGNLNKKFAKEVLKLYFKDRDGFDFSIKTESVAVGIEPAYQYEPLRIIVINKDKGTSYIQRGKAWGCYGTQIVSKTNYYNQYKYKSKFIRFVDRWHDLLFEDKNKTEVQK